MRKSKNHQILLQNPILNTTGKFAGNGKFSRQIPNTKIKSESNDHLNSPITPKEIKRVIESLPTKKKHRTRWFQCRILSDLHRRPNTNTLQTIPQNGNRRNTTQLILRSHNYADTKTTQRSNKERELQANFAYEY